jgi:four helix bundle protein
MAKTIGSYRDLIAWQKAYSLGLELYDLNRSFPADERFGLTSQIRRSAIAIASNVAEGYGRGSTTDYLRFLKIARGSLYELDTQLCFATDLGYIIQEEYECTKQQLDETERVLAGLIRSVAASAK